jgi:hypothetical protein
VPGHREQGGAVGGFARWRPHDHGLLVVGALVDQVLDLVLADLDGVVVREQVLLDRLAVDVGAVGAVEVFDEDVGTHHLHHGVLAADGQVVDHDVVVRTPAEGGLVLGDLDFLDHHSVQRNDQFAHACPQFLCVPGAAFSA